MSPASGRMRQLAARCGSLIPAGRRRGDRLLLRGGVEVPVPGSTAVAARPERAPGGITGNAAALGCCAEAGDPAPGKHPAWRRMFPAAPPCGAAVSRTSAALYLAAPAGSYASGTGSAALGGGLRPAS